MFFRGSIHSSKLQRHLAIHHHEHSKSCAEGTHSKTQLVPRSDGCLSRHSLCAAYEKSFCEKRCFSKPRSPCQSSITSIKFQLRFGNCRRPTSKGCAYPLGSSRPRNWCAKWTTRFTSRLVTSPPYQESRVTRFACRMAIAVMDFR